MASRACRTLTKPLKGRLFSSQAAPARSETASLPKQGPKLTKLPNGLLVASVENNSPISQVSVVVNGGSRFEEGHDAGVTHCLRAAAGLTTKNSTMFGITKNIQQVGGDLKCMTTREYVYYTVEATRNHIDVAFNFLRDITTAPTFKPWEVSDIQAKLSIDLGIFKTQPHIRVFELLHEAAFRNALGNSLYVEKYKIGKFSSEQLMHFVKNYYTSGRMALVGVGVDHDFLVAEANKFTPFDSTGATGAKAKYHGGELRKNTPHRLTYSAIAVEGPSLGSPEMFQAGVLQNIMGRGPFVHMGTNNTSRMGRAVSQCTGMPHAVSCINANYTDGGLFGFYAITQPEDTDKVLKTVMEQFLSVKKTGIKDEEFARAVTQLKSQIAMYFEKQHNVLIDLAEQSLGHQKIETMDDIFKQIDAVTKDDVVKLASKFSKGKPTMAVLGDITKTPYLDQLLK